MLNLFFTTRFSYEPQNNEMSDTCEVKKRKSTVIGRFCREQRKWNWCSYYQTKSRLCFDSCCGSLLFHKAIENSISVAQNGKSIYARRLTTAVGNKQETFSVFCIITLGKQPAATNSDSQRGQRCAIFHHLWCFSKCVCLCTRRHRRVLLWPHLRSFLRQLSWKLPVSLW